MKFNVFLLLIFCGSNLCLYSQNNKIDSLLTLLKIDKEDTCKINHLCNLCWEYRTCDIKKSLLYGKMGLELAKKCNYKTGIAVSYNNLGLVAMNQSNYTEANKYFHLSLNLRVGLDDKRSMAVCFNNIGLVFYYQSNYPKAIENYQNSLKIMDELGDKKGMAICYTNIGLIHWHQVDNKKALDYYQKALQLFEEINDKLGICQCFTNIGGVYFMQCDYQRALEYSMKSLQIYEVLGSLSGIATCYTTIGLSYANMKDYKNAIEFYRKSLLLYEKLNNKNGTSLALGNIAELQIRMKNYVEAMNNSDKSLTIAKEISSLENQKTAYSYLANINDSIKNYKKAYKYYKLFKQLNDSIFNVESGKQIKQMEAIYQAEKKQKEIEILEKDKKLKSAELQRQTFQKYVFIIGFILTRLLSIIIYKSYRGKKKANTLLAKQKLIIEEKNEELNQQNEEIITQRDEIEAQRDLVTEQKEYIEEIHHEVSQSINYATRIQEAILPEQELLGNYLADHFVLFKPKDKVSGDFYWWVVVENHLIITVADCTGHGVPGAFMSMLGTSFLREIVVKEYMTNPAIILKRLRKEIMHALKQSSEHSEQKDGMDMALIVINYDTLEMQFAGANNPIYLITRETENNITSLLELKPDKMPVAIYEKMDPFTNQEIKLQKGDIIYLMSDGYEDQFGGEKNKKFMSKRMKELFVNIHTKPMIEQKEILNNTIIDWMNGQEQVDDITVMGIKI